MIPIIKKIKSAIYTITSTFVGCWAGTLYAIQVSLSSMDSVKIENRKDQLSTISSTLNNIGDVLYLIPILLLASGALHIAHLLLINKSRTLGNKNKALHLKDERLSFISWITFTLAGAALSSYFSASSINVELIKQAAMTGIFLICAIIAAVFTFGQYFVDLASAKKQATELSN
ncbi:hypothetical protein [Pseudomonas sp. DY-1]|uniref:hypothetical protein n=1 Tax=Pseudomonas sp. DY-1 TaxID=1755504 RepID=UPI0013C45C8D|nr:hypothetical protein [Pseudomonas sp. DY-1]